MKLASFDIFDTTLIRKCGKPENVFLIMSKKLFLEDKSKQSKFVLWREELTDKLSKININYTLEDLYDFSNVATVYKQEGLTSKSLCKLEYTIESEMLVKNPIIEKKIKLYRDKGYTIAYISDMYLNASFLENILSREGLFKEGDHIYISYKYRARKDDGTLFQLVKSQLNPKLWHHYGDNEYSDYYIPKKMGIKSFCVHYDYSRIESLFNAYSEGIENVLDFSLLTGYLRYFRLTGNNKPEANFAIDYIAPLYYGYVKHVIEDARERGIKTLYFLSRDSYIFLKIAEQLSHEDLELKYLFVSRKSVYPAFRYIATDDEIKIICNSIVKTKERDDFDKKSYELLDAYFCQEGVYDDDVALVDLGWFGSTRCMINKIRTARVKSHCFCYYFGVTGKTLPEICGKYDAYTYSKQISQNGMLTFIFEEYFSLCPYQTTLGYERKGDKIFPVFGKGENIQNIQENINVNIESCIRFTKENIPVELSVLRYYGLNSIISINNYLEKEYVQLLIRACRNDEFLFRRLSLSDMGSFIKGEKLTLNDRLSIETTYGKWTYATINFLRRSYFYFGVICRHCRHLLSHIGC